jgi:molybdopterin biosynthesis enzyme
LKRYLETIKSEEAIRRVLDQVKPIDDEEYLFAHACRGRITTRPVFAQRSNPPFLCSAMDGYAVSFSKTLEADLTNPVFLALTPTFFPSTPGTLSQKAPML